MSQIIVWGFAWPTMRFDLLNEAWKAPRKQWIFTEIPRQGQKGKKKKKMKRIEKRKERCWLASLKVQIMLKLFDFYKKQLLKHFDFHKKQLILRKKQLMSAMFL